MAKQDIVVCSFYTDDDYYRAAAERLALDLDRLGVRHVIEKVDREQGEQWPDICRKKIAFVARICAEHPAARVFWTDVDCAVRELPGFIRSFSADFIGFQRGFGTPATIGYGSRTRFWEPCFFGINATAEGRALIEEAARLERTLEIRATDDYFLEEAWRSHGARLSFQVIPSSHVQRGGEGADDAFFAFGSSGNVAHFKGQVVQHAPIGTSPRGARKSLRTRGRQLAKRVEARLPRAAASRLRSLADRSGLTDQLVSADVAATPERQAMIRALLKSAQSADESGMAAATAQLQQSARATASEDAAIVAARSFLHYARGEGDDREPLTLAWWARPYPGNFGDWLSPLVVAATSGRPLRFQQPSGLATSDHLVAIGSIGRFIKPNSVVAGTGIAAPDTPLNRKARYVSLRGPLTAAELRSQGGPNITSFGDPGLLLRRVVPVERDATNGRIAVVRHTNHRKAPIVLPEHTDELSVLMSHPDEIGEFVRALSQYDAVVTSAMHVMIACHSYGIPCALVTFEGLEDAVPGSGMKYEDYSLGAELDRLHVPVPVATDLTRLDLSSLVSHVTVPDAKLDEIESALSAAVDMLVVAGVR